MQRQCTSCGASMEIPPELLSAACRFCDSPMVDVEGGARPIDGVVPFDVPQERAVSEVKRWAQRQWFAPEALRKAAKPGELQSVYVPMYAYEAETSSSYSARIGCNYTETETYTVTENGKTVTKTRTVTKTEWFGLSGTHARRWHDHLVSASRGVPEVEANGVEPFDLGAAAAWSPERVAGIAAEHPTVPHDDAEVTAAAELRSCADLDIVRNLLPGDKHSKLVTDTQVVLHDTRLVLVPLWTCVMGKGDKAVRVLVNGQTGKVYADVPQSWVKIIALAALVGLLLIAIFYSINAYGGVL